mmetsp:Transcript_432/g.686  ORF Transcript_432/g.686 Transcript_432/m.686 type:complete len:104 (+) Transcript_432:77-388(+)
MIYQSQVWYVPKPAILAPRAQVVNLALHPQPVWHHHSKVTVLKMATADSSMLSRRTLVKRSGEHATVLPAGPKKRRRMLVVEIMATVVRQSSCVARHVELALP